MDDLQVELRAAIRARDDAHKARHEAGLAFAKASRTELLEEAHGEAVDAADAALAAAALGEGTEDAARAALAARDAAAVAVERANAVIKVLQGRADEATRAHVDATARASRAAIAIAKTLASAGAAELRATLARAATLRAALLGVAHAAQRSHNAMHAYDSPQRSYPPINIDGRARWFNAETELEALGVEPKWQSNSNIRSVTEADLMGGDLVALFNANS